VRLGRARLFRIPNLVCLLSLHRYSLDIKAQHDSCGSDWPFKLDYCIIRHASGGLRLVNDLWGAEVPHQEQRRLGTHAFLEGDVVWDSDFRGGQPEAKISLCSKPGQGFLREIRGWIETTAQRYSWIP